MFHLSDIPSEPKISEPVEAPQVAPDSTVDIEVEPDDFANGFALERASDVKNDSEDSMETEKAEIP